MHFLGNHGQPHPLRPWQIVRFMNPTAFEKRVRRRITARPQDFFAVCPPGLKTLCKNEVEALGPGVENIEGVPGGVAFSCKLAQAWQANLCLGSPSKILMRIAAFRADNFSMLEKKIRQLDWELFLPSQAGQPGNLAIQVTTHKSRLYHSDAIAERCRSLIEARLSGSELARDLEQKIDLGPGRGAGEETGGGLAVLSPKKSCQTLMIRAEHDRFELSLDMSGEFLFKRGIKQRVMAAPLRENLAFAILKTAGFSHQDVLVDPMCGSGTFSLEAAMIQSHIPPGFFRSFAFEQWPGFRPESFLHLKTHLQKQFMIQTDPKIFASDTDSTALSILEDAIEQYEFLKSVQTGTIDFFNLQPWTLTRQKGVVVLNPPYGKRLGSERDITGFYTEIGKKLAADFRGWRAAVIYPEKELGRSLGLSLRPMPFFHGGLDLFAGIGKIPG